jgi:DNA-binding MarR family transcriptional regulator
MMNNPLLRYQQALQSLQRSLEEVNYSVSTDNTVTSSQILSLMALDEDEPIGMTALSRRLQLANSTITRMIDQLVKKGLAERLANPYDRRTIRVQLTPAGRHLRQQLLSGYNRIFERLMERLPSEKYDNLLNDLEEIGQVLSETAQQNKLA